MGGLVEEAQREQLTGKGLAEPRLAIPIQPTDDRPRGGGLERAGPNRRGIETEAAERLTQEWNALHVPPSLACPAGIRLGAVPDTLSRPGRPRADGWSSRARSTGGAARSRRDRTRRTSAGRARAARIARRA